MGLAKFSIYAGWKENAQHQLCHAFILESGEVDVVDPLDVGNEGREYDELHVGEVMRKACGGSSMCDKAR